METWRLKDARGSSGEQEKESLMQTFKNLFVIILGYRVIFQIFGNKKCSVLFLNDLKLLTYRLGDVDEVTEKMWQWSRSGWRLELRDRKQL